MGKEDFKWKLGRIFYDLAEGKIGVLEAFGRYDSIENEKVADVIESFCICTNDKKHQEMFEGENCLYCGEKIKRTNL